VGVEYSTYVAGVQTFYEGVILFIALNNKPLVNLIFQIGEKPSAVFSIGTFEFALLQNATAGHVCQYHVKLGDDTQIITCLGIDSVSCGVASSVDFVNFVWDYNNMPCWNRSRRYS
jgi:hypothetical protein